MLRLYNSLTRKKQTFREIHKGSVHMYSCGPTVYDFAHIGNFRAYICSDLLRRWLAFEGYNVMQVMNLTDVDDKTIRNSLVQKIPLDVYTRKYKDAFFEDVKALRIMPADVYPEASKCIAQMVALVEDLMKKGFAYKGEDGSVYYDISKFKNYGKLSGIKKDELKAGARVKQDEYAKDSAHDFALWKAWDDSDGDVFWETPLGKGRPGWHLECSIMSTMHLGKHFDLHTGGIDLLFPHHENEIAQSEAAFGVKFVNYWVHNEWLLVDGKKMSKSLGNFHTLRDLLKDGFTPLAIRYLLLSVHYKVQLNFTKDALHAAQSAVDRLQAFVDRLTDVTDEKGRRGEIEFMAKDMLQKFSSAMDDDLNISTGLGYVFELVKEINKMIDDKNIGKKDAASVLDAMRKLNRVLDVIDFEKKHESIDDDVQKKIDERDAARAKKDWKRSDELRDELKKKGIELIDTKDGVKWKKIIK